MSPARAPLGPRARRRRPARADRRRARPRQVAPHRGVPSRTGGDPAYLGRMERLAALAEHAAASNCRMGSAAIRRPDVRRRTTPRRPRGTLRLIRPRPSGTRAPARAARRHPAAAKTAPRDLLAEELRRRQLAAMIAWVLAGARSQPLVLAFEDLHWADPTSLDLLRAFAERGAQAPLLVLATTRPEFRAPWSLRSHHSLISLSPLDRAGVARMVGEISAAHALSKELIEGVNERTGGVPLFVEEVTRLLLERGEKGGVQAIPPTLQQSLAARLDRLGRRVRSRRSARFSDAILPMRCCATSPKLMSRRCKRHWIGLAEADLLFVEGAPPQANYRFKHALIQDAAYESLLKSRRQALHRRAAEAPARRSRARRSRAGSRRPSFHAKPASTNSPSNGGARRATRLCAARPSRRRSPISARRSRWRTGRARRCAAQKAARPFRTSD